jgi:hypothetical protein
MSDRRREWRWSANSASDHQSGSERSKLAVARLHRIVRRFHFSHNRFVYEVFAPLPRGRRAASPVVRLVVVVPTAGHSRIGYIKQVFPSQIFNVTITESDIPFTTMPSRNCLNAWVADWKTSHHFILPRGINQWDPRRSAHPHHSKGNR